MFVNNYFRRNKFFDFYVKRTNKNGKYNCSTVSLIINGTMSEVFRFLGEVRPIGLLDKFLGSEANQMLRTTYESKIIKKVEDGGTKEVAVMQTSSRTFLANGFAAHNCYLLDQQIEKIYTSKPSLWPEWFRSAIGWEDNELLR